MQLNSPNSKAVTTMSYSGVDIRVFAMVNHWSNLEYQNNIQQANQDFTNALYQDSLISPQFVEGDPNLSLQAEQMNFEVAQQQSNFNKYTQQLSEVTFKELAELQTISYSVYRDKAAVPVLGSSHPRGFTRGDVTIAGTMIFTVVHERILHEILNLTPRNLSEPQMDLKFLRVDELPPLDLFISFQNEGGAKSRLGIYGLEFINEGQVMSVADLITENSVNYVARHISPMRLVDSIFPDETDLASLRVINGVSILDSEYKQAKNELNAIKKGWL